jgi:hypothetical protein
VAGFYPSGVWVVAVFGGGYDTVFGCPVRD